MTKMTKEQPYLVCDYGSSEKGAYAFHVEGYLTKAVRYEPEKTESGKKSYARFSVGISRNAWQLLGEEGAYPETAFLDGVCFGYAADRIQNLEKGQKIVFSGRLQKREFTRRTGETGYTVEAVCDHVAALSTRRGCGSVMNASVSHVTRKTVRNGAEEEQNLVCLLSGSVVAVEDVREVNGNRVLNWQMEIPLEASKMAAIVKGSYRKEADYGNRKLVRCSIWGKRAEKLAPVLEGKELVVTGIPVSRIYQGNEFVDLLVRDLSVTRRLPDSDPKEQDAQTEAHKAFYAEEWSGGMHAEDWTETDSGEVPPLPF